MKDIDHDYLPSIKVENTVISGQNCAFDKAMGICKSFTDWKNGSEGVGLSAIRTMIEC